jgi:hypothetical protein
MKRFSWQLENKQRGLGCIFFKRRVLQCAPPPSNYDRLLSLQHDGNHHFDPPGCCDISIASLANQALRTTAAADVIYNFALELCLNYSSNFLSMYILEVIQLVELCHFNASYNINLFLYKDIFYINVLHITLTQQKK